MRTCIRNTVLFLAIVVIAAWGAIVYYYYTMPEQFSVTEGKALHLNGAIEVKDTVKSSVRDAVAATAGNSYRSSLQLFGVIPVKEITVQVVKEPVVVVAGIPFGIKMYTDGVLVVGFSQVDTASGPCNPARIAGLKEGDVILSVDDTKVSTNYELRALIEQSKGEKVTLRVRRDNLQFDIQFCAVLSVTENRYRSGFWVRDSSAGIGTLTFFEPESKSFGGLGHAVCDVDTDEKLPISTGEIVTAEIFDVEKSVSGSAGSLNGTVGDEVLGIIMGNTDTGLYGKLTRLPHISYHTMPVAMKQQVKEGKAQIYTTVEGKTPAFYAIEIEQVRYRDASPTKNMVIRVTDERLLGITGGIVQGMSGSPIIQDGKLVGAVTHVFVNDPAKGYGIFAENMLETAQSVSQKQLKEAS